MKVSACFQLASEIVLKEKKKKYGNSSSLLHFEDKFEYKAPGLLSTFKFVYIIVSKKKSAIYLYETRNYFESKYQTKIDLNIDYSCNMQTINDIQQIKLIINNKECHTFKTKNENDFGTLFSFLQLNFVRENESIEEHKHDNQPILNHNSNNNTNNKKNNKNNKSNINLNKQIINRKRRNSVYIFF